jgi:hypothetical protein
MKRFLLLLTPCCLLLATTAHAQLGLRAGANLAGFNTSTNNGYRTSTGSLLGYQAGVFYQLPLSKRLSLVPEVQFSQERMTLTRFQLYVVSASLQGDYRERLSYLNVPVLLRYTIGPVYVEAGAQGGFLLGGRETGNVTFGSSYSVDREVVGRYRRYDVGPSVGVGLKLPAGVGLSVRAYQGLVSLTQDGEANVAHLYRRSVQASLTFQL